MCYLYPFFTHHPWMDACIFPSTHHSSTHLQFINPFFILLNLGRFPVLDMHSYEVPVLVNLWP